MVGSYIVTENPDGGHLDRFQFEQTPDAQVGEDYDEATAAISAEGETLIIDVPTDDGQVAHVALHREALRSVVHHLWPDWTIG